MDELKQIRKKIDGIDLKIATLLKERFDAIGEVAFVKKYNSLPVSDPKREEEIINRLAEETGLARYIIKDVYHIIFSYSKAIQENYKG